MLPKINSKENKKSYLKGFGGLDRRQIISDFSLSETYNISCDDFPALSPCRESKVIADVESAQAICPPEYAESELTSFTGVKDNKFIYKGEVIEGTLSDGKKSIADFNGKICIFPDKVFYDYIPDSKTGEISKTLVSMEKSLSVSGAKFYSAQNNITGEYTSYISADKAGFTSSFKTGDSIIISDCSKPENNVVVVESRKDTSSEDAIVSAVIKKITDKRIDLILYKKSGEKAEFSNVTESGKITLKLAIPQMDHICVHNNRLWGTASSGEYIYASKLGDATNFNSFQGLSDDSWYSYVATGGKFTGICSYRTSVVAFKENCIHHVYGDSPRNFSIPKHTKSGCIDGRSICEIGGVLYYLSSRGFYGYQGGEPYHISPVLNREYSFCTGETDGMHYYVSATTDDNVTDFMVYTPDKNIWLKRDNTHFIDMCSYNGRVYGLADNKMLLLNGGEKAENWYASTKAFSYDTFDFKGVYEVFVRAFIKKSASIIVLISYDGEKWTKCGSIDGSNTLSSYRIPIRFKKCDNFKLRLHGKGDAVIHNVEIINYKGGRNYGQNYER